jgi:hypothetical protein
MKHRGPNEFGNGLLRRWLVPGAAVALVLAGVTGALAAPVYDLGCIASDRPDLQGRAQFRALGPLVEWTRDGSYSLRGIRPFFTSECDARDREVLDVLWPLATFRRWDRETDWRVLVAFGSVADTTDPASRYHAWLFPFLFWGRDGEGRNYQAFFPIGGTIREFMGRDVSFVLFPLYSYSTINSLKTHNVLYPVVSWTTGDRLRKFRVFPLYARSVKKDDYDKRFVMWPIWSSVRYERPGARGKGFILFPIYGHLKLENQESWMVLPPFNRWTISPKGRDGYFLWPFIHIASGEKDQFQVWPLYGRKRTAAEATRFALWPIVYSRHTPRPAGDANTFRVFPFYYSFRQSVTNTATRVQPARSVCVWPLFDYDRTGDRSRVRVLDLWPPRNTPGIERNLAPLWTLYRFEKTELGREHELLWGLAHWERSATGVSSGSVFPLTSWATDGTAGTVRRWDVLKGLMGYERQGSARRYRALYLFTWGDQP